MNWIRIEQRKPLTIEAGGWEGLKSAPILVSDKEGKYHVAVMYEGNSDGSYFYEFYDNNNIELKNVTHWMQIPLTTDQICFKTNTKCRYGCQLLCQDAILALPITKK